MLAKRPRSNHTHTAFAEASLLVPPKRATLWTIAVQTLFKRGSQPKSRSLWFCRSRGPSFLKLSGPDSVTRRCGYFRCKRGQTHSSTEEFPKGELLCMEGDPTMDPSCLAGHGVSFGTDSDIHWFCFLFPLVAHWMPDVQSASTFGFRYHVSSTGLFLSIWKSGCGRPCTIVS